MIKANTNDENKKRLVSKLIREQQKDQNRNTVYSQKVKTPSLDRWSDITIGQIKILVHSKKLTFEELVTFLFIEIFQYSINSLSHNLKVIPTSRRALTDKYDNAITIIKDAFKRNFKKVYIKHHKSKEMKKTISVGEEVKEVFEEWNEYSKDYSNFVDNRYRQRNEHRKKKYDG